MCLGCSWQVVFISGWIGWIWIQREINDWLHCSYPHRDTVTLYTFFMCRLLKLPNASYQEAAQPLLQSQHFRACWRERLLELCQTFGACCTVPLSEYLHWEYKIRQSQESWGRALWVHLVQLLLQQGNTEPCSVPRPMSVQAGTIRTWRPEFIWPDPYKYCILENGGMDEKAR